MTIYPCQNITYTRVRQAFLYIFGNLNERAKNWHKSSWFEELYFWPKRQIFETPFLDLLRPLHAIQRWLKLEWTPKTPIPGCLLCGKVSQNLVIYTIPGQSSTALSRTAHSLPTVVGKTDIDNIDNQCL